MIRTAILIALLTACTGDKPPQTDTDTTGAIDSGTTALTDGITKTCEGPEMLAFADQAHFQSVAEQLDDALLAWTDDTAPSPLEDFEVALSFASLRKSLAEQAEALAADTGGLDPGADPEDFWVEDDTLRVMLNTELEVMIGSSIFKIIDECHMIEITDGDCETLAAMRGVLDNRETAEHWEALAAGLENVTVHDECDASYKTAAGCSVEMTASAGSQPREVAFTSDVHPAESTITKWENASYVWDFGDGSTSAGSSTTHTYTADDQYTMSVTFTGDYYTEVCTLDDENQLQCEWVYQDTQTCASDSETHYISGTCFEDFDHQTDGCGNLRVQDTSQCWSNGAYADCGGTSSWLVDGDPLSGAYGDWELIPYGSTGEHSVCVGNSNCSGEECQTCDEATSILQCDRNVSEKETLEWSDNGEERVVIAKMVNSNWLLSRRLKGKVVVRKVKNNGNYGSRKKAGYLSVSLEGSAYDKGNHDADCAAPLGSMQLSSDKHNSRSHREGYIAGSAYRVHPEELRGEFYVAEDSSNTNQSQTIDLIHAEGTCFQ